LRIVRALVVTSLILLYRQLSCYGRKITPYKTSYTPFKDNKTAVVDIQPT
jgi:hypothetical protein